MIKRKRLRGYQTARLADQPVGCVTGNCNTALDALCASAAGCAEPQLPP